MGTSVLHIKTEVECRVYLFDEEKGIAKPGTYFNLKMHKDVSVYEKEEISLHFIGIKNMNKQCQLLYQVEYNTYCDKEYWIKLEKILFGLNNDSSELLRDMLLAERKNSESRFLLAKRYHYGIGVKQNPKEAVKWYRKSARQKYADAQYNLGVCYYNGDLVKKNRRRAVRLYSKAAKQDHVDAQNSLGLCYFKSSPFLDGDTGVDYGNKNNEEKAAELFRKAAAQGYADAQYNLGCLIYKVDYKGVKRDIKEVIEWYQTVGQKSDMTEFEVAKYHLPSHRVFVPDVNNYQKSICVLLKKMKEATEWYQKAAEQGHANAQCSLGLCCMRGIGMKHDWEEAKKWFRLAAEQGHTDAQNYLGGCFYWMDGNKDAVEWFHRAAEQGHADAQYNLGWYYERREDYDEALTWYMKSTKHHFGMKGDAWDGWMRVYYKKR